MFDILVVGGGASGMFSAICAAETGKVSVAVVERSQRVGRKILATGNGRCNITNTNTDISRYHGKNVRFAVSALKKMMQRQ